MTGIFDTKYCCLLLSDAILLIDHPTIHLPQPSTWADLGAGNGLFARALGSLLAAGSTIYAVDKKPGKIEIPGVAVENIRADFVADLLPIPQLDGILMANAFHYVREKESFIEKMRPLLHPAALWLIVEYDTNRPVRSWVPYPIEFVRLRDLFSEAGFTHCEKINEYPSAFGGRMYSAMVSFLG